MPRIDVEWSAIFILTTEIIRATFPKVTA